MKVLKIALALAIAAISSFTAHAKNDPTTAYMFGFASSFSDSTVYMTSVQRVDSVYLTHKKLFLDNRENYSLQLKEYLESIGAPKRTCIVIFDRNFKKAEKKWTKLHDRYTKQAKAKRLKNGEKPKGLPTPWQMKNIDESKFMFKAVEPSDMEEPKTKAEKKEAKAQLKQKKAEVKSQLKQRKAEVKQKKAEQKQKKAEAKKKAEA